MQTTWSLIINICMLIGVIIAIVRMMKVKQKKSHSAIHKPMVGTVDARPQDEIIAVRKMQQKSLGNEVVQNYANTTATVSTSTTEAAPLLMMFLLAKDKRQFAGYELLQTILAAGMRFGEGQLFHRHQHPNGHGPILCSMAAATADGMFDLQNIGAFRVHGLCLFMHTSGNATIDSERFALMFDTAKQLSEGLDAHLLDDERKPLSEASLLRYYERLNINEAVNEAVAV